MTETPDACFGHMQQLLKEWLSHARLLEITALIQLAKLELGRRGITLTYTVDQTSPPSDPSSHTGSGG